MHVTEARILIGSAVVSAVVALLVVVHKNREAPPANARIEIRSEMPSPPKPAVMPDPLPANPCANVANADDIEQRADANIGSGNYAAALQGYEQLLACKPALLRKTYLAACRSRSFDKAKTYFKQIGQEALAQICLRDGFDPR
jgi:hypothetical protein